MFKTTHSPNIFVVNGCEGHLTIGGGICSYCEQAVLTSSASKNVFLTAFTDNEETQTINVPWELDEQSGTIVVETAFTEPTGNSCNGWFGCRCTRPTNNSQHLFALLLAGGAAWRLRRKKA